MDERAKNRTKCENKLKWMNGKKKAMFKFKPKNSNNNNNVTNNFQINH